MSLIPADTVPAEYRTPVLFHDTNIEILSAPTGKRLDVSTFVRNPSDFHGPTDVDHVVLFGQALRHLVGTFPIPEGINKLEDIQVLALRDERAAAISASLKQLALEVVHDDRLYDNIDFCRQYYDLARKGYALFEPPREEQIPVSLIRAGLVTTRLAYGLGIHDHVPREVRVETKRSHPKHGAADDMMVTVRWDGKTDPQSLHDKDLLIADFVNPASWASTAALLEVLKHRYDVVPKTVELRSFMGTIQGVNLARSVCKQLGITPRFTFVDIAGQMDAHYYLTGDKVVADAGHVLRHFQPSA